MNEFIAFLPIMQQLSLINCASFTFYNDNFFMTIIMYIVMSVYVFSGI